VGGVKGQENILAPVLGNAFRIARANPIHALRYE
jgi:hypothetical protein